MKKINLLLVPVFFVSLGLSAADEIKWGMSIGYEKIDYGITLENTDSGTSSSDIAIADVPVKSIF